jgi:hypothetical protein
LNVAIPSVTQFLESASHRGCHAPDICARATRTRTSWGSKIAARVGSTMPSRCTRPPGGIPLERNARQAPQNLLCYSATDTSESIAYHFRARATADYRIDQVHVVPQRHLGRDQRSWPIELIALPFQIDVFDPLRSDTSRPSRLRRKQWCALKGHVPGRSTLLAPTMGPIFRGEPFPTFPKLEILLCVVIKELELERLPNSLVVRFRRLRLSFLTSFPRPAFLRTQIGQDLTVSLTSNK